MIEPRRRALPALVCLAALLAAPEARAQTRILPLGDSITQGGQDFASYRYDLWFDLQQAGYVVDFVGSRTTINGSDPPSPVNYPDYLTSFDRDHEGYWGWRTDEILTVMGGPGGIAATAQAEIALVQLGTNDIGQNGAAGVTAADTNLRQIIAELRAVDPGVDVLLAQVTPIGPASGYFPNEPQVAPLNAAIAQIAADLDTPGARVILVDQNSGFDLTTMMQPDDLHPNLLGEQQMSGVWQASLTPLLTPGNPPPSAQIDTPGPGASFPAPAAIAIEASASDDGSVVGVELFVDGVSQGTDATPPYEWIFAAPAPAAHTLQAVAEDDLGATGASPEVVVQVVPAGSSQPVAIVNPSFEDPPLTDGILAQGPGTIGGWTFSASANTFLGIFDPPAASYPDAGGSGTPAGADGENVAFLFNDGGPAEFVEATQTLAEVVQAGSDYTLTVAIGRFLPGQPYSFSTYGGYRIELLAGATVIASDSDTILPDVGAFRDAIAHAPASTIPAGALGQPLAIRLGISATAEDRSTHFDDVRLVRGVVAVDTLPSLPAAVALALLLAALAVSPRARSIRGRARRARARG